MGNRSCGCCLLPYTRGKAPGDTQNAKQQDMDNFLRAYGTDRVRPECGCQVHVLRSGTIDHGAGCLLDDAAMESAKAGPELATSILVFAAVTSAISVLAACEIEAACFTVDSLDA